MAESMTSQTATVAATLPAILVREGTCHGRRWRHYMVITDGRVALVEMEPALLYGWNVTRVTIQGSADWAGMSAASIVQFKLGQNDGLTAHATDINPEFLAKLLAY